VGCVLVNFKNHILATGYNGVPAGHEHCEDSPCPGAISSSGNNLDKCYAIHAEQNALLQCSNVYDISVCYTTTSLCMSCTKLLLNTSCKRIVYFMPYQSFEESKQLWTSSKNRTWEIVDSKSMIKLEKFKNDVNRTLISTG